MRDGRYSLDHLSPRVRGKLRVVAGLSFVAIGLLFVAVWRLVTQGLAAAIGPREFLGVEVSEQRLGGTIGLVLVGGFLVVVVKLLPGRVRWFLYAFWMKDGEDKPVRRPGALEYSPVRMLRLAAVVVPIALPVMFAMMTLDAFLSAVAMVVVQRFSESMWGQDMYPLFAAVWEESWWRRTGFMLLLMVAILMTIFGVAQAINERRAGLARRGGVVGG